MYPHHDHIYVRIYEVYVWMLKVLDGLAVESKGGPVIIDDVSNKMINFTPFHL